MRGVIRACQSNMRPIFSLSGLLASAGTVVAAMVCAFCFPALGTIAASVGLGFLSAYEGILITQVLPILAVVALLFGLLAWWNHRVPWRGALSLVGPLIVLAALYPLWQYGWSTTMLYFGLLVMLVVSIFDFIKPPRSPSCRT